MYDLTIEVEDEAELKKLQATIQETLLKKTQGITDVEEIDSELDNDGVEDEE